MKKLLPVFVFILCAALAVGADLATTDFALIEQAGIPVYEQAIFAYGNQSIGFRFATNASPDTVRQWYREKLPSWSVSDRYGSWILYNGKPGLGMGEIMARDQVSIQTNDNLPTWHSLAADMTTEIVLMVFP